MAISADEKNHASNKVIKAVFTPGGRTPKGSQVDKPFFSAKTQESPLNKAIQKQQTLVGSRSNSGYSTKDYEPFNKPSTPFIYYMTNLEKSHKSILENEYFTQIYRDHFIQTFQAMTFCRYLRPVDHKVLQQKKVVLERRESHKSMYHQIN